MSNSIFTVLPQGRRLGRMVGLARGEAFALDDQTHDTIENTDLLYCPRDLRTLRDKRGLKVGGSVSR